MFASPPARTIWRTIIAAIDETFLVERFLKFAEMECSASPLYRELAQTIAGNAELLSLAAVAANGPVPNLMLAAIHDLLMRSPDVELASYFPTLTEEPRPPQLAGRALATFVNGNHDALAEVLSRRLVQTNEVRRALALYLTVAWLADREGPDSLDLVEIGCSAGLLLAFDHYGYRVRTDRVVGARASKLLIEAELRGNLPAGITQPLPIAKRIGIDLNTLDVDDRSDRRWLRALVWGDQPERLALLDQAIEVARSVPLELHEGDGNALLPGILAKLDPSHATIVLHSHALNQFPANARARFDEVLRHASTQRPIYRISLEYAGDTPCVELMVYRAGECVEQVRLARYDAHGAWIEWLGASGSG